MNWKFFNILMILSNLVAFPQPSACLVPPVGYQKGGDFDIVVQQNGVNAVSDYLCIAEKATVERIEVINKSGLLKSSI